MWSRLFTTETTDTDENEAEEGAISNPPVERSEEELEQQNLIIDQLKTLLRENEGQLQEKSKEFTDLSLKFQRFQIQSKAKIASLTNQLKDKPPKKDEGEFDDTSSSDSSEYGSRGKVLLLRKQLETSKQQLDKNEKENKVTFERFTQRVKDLEHQLSEKNDMITSFSIKEDESEGDSTNAKAPAGSEVNEMYAQIVYKDSKILDLNNQILEQERRIIDLQEHIREKEEVLQTRNLAVQLMSADMSRKGKSVVDDLEETRQQMKIMQSNFADTELEWKTKLDSLNVVIQSLKTENEQLCEEKDAAISTLDGSLKKTEAARYELAAKNAELQKRVILTEEKTEKQCESFRKQFEEKCQALQKELNQEKSQAAELRKALSESTNQSESKILKARVKERTKLKALERELAALKNLQQKEQKTEDVTQLQQQVAVLEEEKGTLQLRLMEVDEQISAQDDLKLQYSDMQLLLKEKEDIVISLEEEIRLEKEKREVLITRMKETNASYKQLKHDYEEANNMNLSLGKDLQDIISAKEAFENNVNLLEEKSEDLTSQNQELLDEVNSLKDMNIGLNMKVIQLEEVIDGEQQQKNEIQHKLQELQETMDNSSEYSLREEIKKLQTTCNELSKSLQSAEVSHKEKQLQVEKLEKDLRRITLDFEKSQSKSSDYEAEVAALTSKLEDAKSIYEEKVSECAVLCNQKVECEENLAKLLSISSSKDVAHFEEVWNDHQGELEKYKKDYENALDQQQQLEENSQYKADEIQSLNIAIMELNSQLEVNYTQFEKEKDFINENLKRQLEIKNKLEISMHEANDEFEKLSSVIQEKDENIQNLNAAIQEKANIMSLLEEDNMAANKEIDKLKTNLVTEAEKTKARISSLLEQNSDLETEVSRLNEEVSTKGHKESIQEQNLQSLQSEIQNATEKQKNQEEFYQNSLIEKDKLIHGFQEQMSLLENAVQKRDQDLAEVEKMRNILTSENSDLKQTLVNVRDSMEKLEADLQHQKEVHLKELKNSGNEISMLNDEINTYKQQVISLQEIISSSELSSSEKENVNQSLLEENFNLKRECGRLESQEKSSTESLQELSQEFIHLKNQHERLLKDNKEIISSNNALQKEASEKQILEEKLLKLREEIVEKEREFSEIINAKELEIHQQQEAVISLQSSLEAIHDTVQQKDINLKDLVGKLESLEVNSTGYENEIESLSSSLREKVSEIEKYQNSVQSLQKEITQLKDDSIELTEGLMAHLKSVLYENDCLDQSFGSLFDQPNVTDSDGSELKDKISAIVATFSESAKERASLKDKLIELHRDAADKEKERQKTINSLQTHLKATQKAFKENEETLEDCMEKLKTAENSNRTYEEGMKRVLSNAKEKARELRTSEAMVDALKREVEFLNNTSSTTIQRIKDTSLLAFSKMNEQELELTASKEQINSLQDREKELEEENRLLVDMNHQCKSYLINFGALTNEDCTLDEAVRQLTAELVTFKNECSQLFNEISSTTVEAEVPETDKEEHSENQLSILSQLKKHIQDLCQSRNELNRQVERLTEQNNALSLDESGVRNQYTQLQNDNELMKDDLCKCKLNLQVILSQMSNVAENNDQILQNALSKVNVLCDKVKKLSSFKERIQRLYISHKEHEYQMIKMQEEHVGEVNTLTSSAEEEKHLLSEIVIALREEIEERNQRLETANEQLDMNCQALDTLTEKVRLLEEQNEQLSTGMSANRDNYSNDFVTLHRRLSDAYSTISVLRTAITEIKSIHEQLRHQQLNEYHSAVAAVTNLQNEMEVLNSNLTKTVDENINLKITTEELNRRRQEQSVQIAELESNFSNANSSFVEASKNKDTVIEEQNSQLKTVHDTIEALKLELKTSQDSCAILQTNFAECSQLYEDIWTKYNRTKRLIQNINAATTVSKTDISALNNLNVGTNVFEQDFSTVLEQLLHSIVFNVESKKQLSHEIVQYQSEIQELTSKVVTLTTALDMTSSENREMNAELSILKEAVQMVQETEIIPKTCTLSLETGDRKYPAITQEILVTSSPGPSGDSSVGKTEVEKLKKKLIGLNEKINSLTNAYEKEIEKSSHLQERLVLAEKNFNQLCKEHGCYEDETEKAKSTLLATADKWKNEVSVLKNTQVELQESHDRKSMEVQQHLNMICQLELKIKADETSISTLMVSCQEAQNKSELLAATKHDLENRLKNLQEHADMLMSDNETYQGLVEKLKLAKHTLEKDIRSLNDRCLKDNEQLTFYELELKKQADLLTETNNSFHEYKTKQEKKIQNLLSSRDQLQSLFQETKNKCQELESENISLRETFEPVKKDDACQTSSPMLQQTVNVPIVLTTSSQTGDLLGIEKYQSQINNLTKDLMSSRNALQEWQKTEHLWKEQYAKMELHYQQAISNLQQQQSMVQLSSGDITSYNQLQEVNRRLDMELQQALSSLHKQNARSEELNMELSTLIDERNSAKQKLNHFQQHIHVEYPDHARENVSLLRNSETPPDVIKISVPSEEDHKNLQLTQSQAEIAKLHQRLQETEKICKELRKANEALDGKLIVEREQRELVEEELGFAQRQLMPADRSNKDEYHILLGDLDEPEMLVETNFSITRKVQGHAHKVRRWLRGRRLYMHKLCQRRKYSELLYIVYLWALHFWLFWCIFEH